MDGTHMRIGVIGAGVIGVTAALALLRDGHDVTILDREGVAAGASQGNAGAFAFSDIVPLATPGILRQAPGWLFDPLGPLTIRPGYALSILPWLARFARASMPGRFAAALAAQAALMTRSRAALDRLLPAIDGERLIRREGQLQLYDDAAQMRAAAPSWKERERAGIAFETLTDAAAIAAIQPGIAPRFTHAVFTPDWINVTDPKAWTEHVAGAVLAGGGRIERRAVRALIPEGPRVRAAFDGGEARFDRVVLAAGAQSKALLPKDTGLSLPLETERGYNTTLPSGAFDLRTHLTFSSHGFVVTRIGDGVRVGGAVELGGLSLPPNMKRAEALLAKAAAFLPRLQTSGGTQWMGFRPSMPDSLPVIGPLPRHPSMLVAFGHGHLGLTQSAGTAELVADLVARRAPGMDLSPYRPGRFTRGAA